MFFNGLLAEIDIFADLQKTPPNEVTLINEIGAYHIYIVIDTIMRKGRWASREHYDNTANLIRSLFALLLEDMRAKGVSQPSFEHIASDTVFALTHAYWSKDMSALGLSIEDVKQYGRNYDTSVYRLGLDSSEILPSYYKMRIINVLNLDAEPLRGQVEHFPSLCKDPELLEHIKQKRQNNETFVWQWQHSLASRLSSGLLSHAETLEGHIKELVANTNVFTS